MGCTASKPAGANGGADGPEITSTPYATVYEVDGVRDIDGNPVDMKQFEGKLIFAMAIATGHKKCARELEDLAEVQQKLGPKGVEFLVFPCNDFGSQPEDAAAVKAACQKAGYTGRIMEFASVKGPTAHPLWVFLRVKDPGSTMRVTADFAKGLTNKKGLPFGRWSIGAAPHIVEPYASRALHGAMCKKDVEPKAGVGGGI